MGAVICRPECKDSREFPEPKTLKTCLFPSAHMGNFRRFTQIPHRTCEWVKQHIVAELCACSISILTFCCMFVSVKSRVIGVRRLGHAYTCTRFV